MMRIVNVHHVYYATFEKGNAEYGDSKKEVVMVFGTRYKLADLVA